MSCFTLSRIVLLSMVGLILGTSTGCSTIKAYHIPAVPASQVPPQFLGTPRENLQTVSFARLRQEPPEVYRLGPNDILGIDIATILSKEDEAPPVHFPEEGERAPSIGFPFPVREDGTVALPLVPPILVEGKTLEESTELIRKAYTVDKKLIPAGKDAIIVTLLRRRTYEVLVVRQEEGGKDGVTKKGEGFALDLPAYENDLLHALNETGGLPGLDAKDEIYIYRGMGDDAEDYDAMISHILACREPCSCPPELPPPPNVTVIPLRYYPGQPPTFTEEDIILNEGDIVVIESRDNERFYTGGVLGGGEFRIPKDYDIDVLDAIAIAGGTIGSSGAVLSQVQGGGRGGGYGRGGGSGPIPPSEAIIIREICDGREIPIRIDLNEAITDPSQRILIQPEDVILVRYTCGEEIANTFLGLLQFNFLFSGLGGGGI